MWAIETVATIDFETYSEAGFAWNEAEQKWDAPRGSTKKGIAAVGTVAYAEHPSTEVLVLSYQLPCGRTGRWIPGLALPIDLLIHIATGGLIEAHNVMFERAIWHYVLHRRHGWPDLPPAQLRCNAARARVNNLPGALGNLTDVLPVKTAKNPDGKRLINKFCVPQKPTKKKPSKRIFPQDDPQDAELLYAYCDTDVGAEHEAASLMMPMSIAELRFWQLDQDINWRGVAVDRASVRNMIAVLEQAFGQYGDECLRLTGGIGVGQVAKLKDWLATRGVHLESMESEVLDEFLNRKGRNDPIDPAAARVLEIRQMIGSASVKKLFAFERSCCDDDRLRGVIIHHGARTGRPTGELVQPLNLPKAGPKLAYCGCGAPHARKDVCPWCNTPVAPDAKRYKWGDKPKGWDGDTVDYIQAVMATRDLRTVEHYLGDAVLSVSGSVRGMIVAGEGCDYIASDYSAIEAVVTAALSGCQWRLDTFHRKEDIYLHSAAKIIPGRSYEFYKQYERDNGSHHPDRQKTGKVAELALGFGGWVGGWRGFDDSDTFTDDEVKKNILAWRAASPEIVEMWGGQARGRPWEGNYRLERFGFEGAFVNAVQYPTQTFTSNGIRFFMRGDCLVIKLLSGRELAYHSPRLWPSDRQEGTLKITYMTWNSNAKYGAFGWVAMSTYAGRIAENIVQATAHDIQRFGIEALVAAGYPIVLHVYDENIAEVPKGFGTIEEFEAIMSTMPDWAAGWPIRASGGWRGRRYRKG